MKKIVTMFAMCSFLLVGSAMAMDSKSHDMSKPAEHAPAFRPTRA